jgi:hypothetical protein
MMERAIMPFRHNNTPDTSWNGVLEPFFLALVWLMPPLSDHIFDHSLHSRAFFPKKNSAACKGASDMDETIKFEPFRGQLIRTE